MPLIDQATGLINYADRSFRQQGIPAQRVVSLFQDLHQTVSQLHQAQVVIGDFNDLNVLVKGTEAFVIDADSFQFKSYLCRVFTSAFVDPLLCDPWANTLCPIKPYTPESDWYAFAVMLMQCLLYVGPYGGVYRPQNHKLPIPHDRRPLAGITIFHPEVRYPKPAIPYDVLPDELLHQFHLLFEKKWRGPWPTQLLAALQWRQCCHCQTEHARPVCPRCSSPGPAQFKIKICGSLTVSTIFETKGMLLSVALHQQHPIWLYYESQQFKREGQRSLFQGELDPQMHFRLLGSTTLIAKLDQLIQVTPQGRSRTLVDTVDSIPIFDVNHDSSFWVSQGQLWRDGLLGPEVIGSVLQHQTRFWVGRYFGFGYYRAGDLGLAFTFATDRHRINDNVQLPLPRGQWIESMSYISSYRCWFLLASQTQGRIWHYCFVMDPQGQLIASAQAERGDGSWLGTLKGKCAVGEVLWVATDEGIVKIKDHSGQLEIANTFPATEPWVDTSCQLLPSAAGLYVISQHQIHLLKLN